MKGLEGVVGPLGVGFGCEEPECDLLAPLVLEDDREREAGLVADFFPNSQGWSLDSE